MKVPISRRADNSSHAGTSDHQKNMTITPTLIMTTIVIMRKYQTSFRRLVIIPKKKSMNSENTL